MNRSSQLVLVALALCALVALLVRSTREPDVASAVRSDAATETPARSTTELASDAVTLSASERAEADPAPTAPITLAPTSVVVRVVDPDGKPIAGARVRLGTSDELERARRDPEARLRLGASELVSPTDAAGRCAFDGVPEEHDVLIVGPEHDDYVAELPWTFARPGSEHVLLMFPVARTNLIVEAVHARTQEPLSNFVASVESLDASRAVGRHMKLIGVRGTARALIQFPPGGALEITLALPTMAIGRGPSTVRVVTPVANEELRVRFELDPELEPVASELGIVTGTVVERASGAPLAGASVTAARRSGPSGAQSDQRAEQIFSVATEREGRFRVAAPVVELQLFVRADGYRVHSRDALAGDELRIELDRGAELRVRVIRRDGQPPAPRWVYLMRLDESGRSSSGTQARTDADGAWKSSGLEPGSWKVRLAPFGLDAPDTNAILADSRGATAAGAAVARADDQSVRRIELSIDTPTEITFEVDE